MQATAPPKLKDKRWLLVPYAYAVALAVVVLVQLIGFGGFDFAGIKIDIAGPAWAILTLAATEIFALPFVLELKLSPLARACSAVLALAAPLLYLAFVVLVRDQAEHPVMPLELIIGAGLGVLAISSFHTLKGEETLVSKAGQ